MMKLTIYQADAFADNVFSGNPAAVIPLQKWLSDETLQHIAMENNLSETAFFIPFENGFHIRWFTPATEVNLCGHATLASAHVLFHHLNYQEKEIRFQSKSGILKVKKEGKLIVLDFPTSEVNEIELSANIEKAFGIKPQKCFRGREDLMFVFEDQEAIENLKPGFHFLKTLEMRGIIATAPSEEFDFVSRFFAPAKESTKTRLPVRHIPCSFPTGLAGWAKRKWWPNKFQNVAEFSIASIWGNGLKLAAKQLPTLWEKLRFDCRPALNAKHRPHRRTICIFIRKRETEKLAYGFSEFIRESKVFDNDKAFTQYTEMVEITGAVHRVGRNYIESNSFEGKVEKPFGSFRCKGRKIIEIPGCFPVFAPSGFKQHKINSPKLFFKWQQQFFFNPCGIFRYGNN
jgi:hypothetical protein